MTKKQSSLIPFLFPVGLFVIALATLPKRPANATRSVP